MEQQLRTSYSRTNALSPVFGKMAEIAMSSFVELESKYKQALENETTDVWLETGTTMVQFGIQVIVFSALQLESGIFDFAAINAGDKFTRNYLDTLDVLSKWVVIPKLLTGKQIRTNHAAYNGLVQLIKDRNLLVHAKSKEYLPSNIPSEEPDNSIDSNHKIFRKSVVNAYKTVLLLSLEIDYQWGAIYNFIGSLQSQRYPERPKNLLPIINDCKQIFAKSVKN